MADLLPQMPQAADYPTRSGNSMTGSAPMRRVSSTWPSCDGRTGSSVPEVRETRLLWRTGAGLWMCKGRSRRTSVTAGTIFARTRTPLRAWFAAMWFVALRRTRVSALGLQRVLGFGSYETAWAWMHKLRRAMVRPDREMLSGLVEVNECFVGGVHRGMPGVGPDKISVLVAAEHLDHNRIGRIRLEPGPADRRLALVKFGQRVVAPGSTIRTDGEDS